MEEDFDTGVSRPADDRPRGVSKAKLSDVELGPKLAIFYRPARNAPMITLEPSFPKEAAIIFCDRIEAVVQNKPVYSYVVTGGDPAAYKMIFEWINDCIQTQSIEKFPDIPEPDDDPFALTINIIKAGEQLGVPAGSLSWHLKKRLNGCARKHLMPFSQVREFYDVTSEAYKLGLKDIACASVFNAWWDARLDELVNPDSMEELFDMRQQIEELDNDLHQACQTREEEIRKKWAEKKAKKEAEQNGTAVADEWDNPGTSGNTNTDFNDEWANPSTVATGGDWDGATAANSPDGWNATSGGLTQATTQASSDWETQNVNHATNTAMNQWAGPLKSASGGWPGDNEDAAPVQNWADEMEEPNVRYSQPATASQW